MTLKEKAEEFLYYYNQLDRRTDNLLLLLSQITETPIPTVLRKIREIADSKE